MDTREDITFWDDCDLVGRDPEMVHGAPVVRDITDPARPLTRLPADALTGNVEAFIEMDGLSEAQAIEATLDCFPGTPGGADTIRKLLAYETAHIKQLQLS